MLLTYECGSCNTRYQLDTDLITQSGIKITCPKCLTFILLRSKADNLPKPMIEKVAEKDGAYHINVPTSPKIDLDIELPETEIMQGTDPKFDIPDDLGLNSDELLPHEPTLDTSIDDDEPLMELSADYEKPLAIPTESQDETMAMEDALVDDFDLLSSGSFNEMLKKQESPPKGPPRAKSPVEIPTGPDEEHHLETGKIHGTQATISRADLLSYPEATPKEGKFDGLIIPLSLIGIVIVGLLFLNYKSIILIPGLENLRSEVLSPEPTPTVAPTIVITPDARYGFPIIEDTPVEEEPSPEPSPVRAKPRK